VTAREAVKALKTRRASAMRGVLDQIQEAGGVKAFAPGEIIDLSKSVLVGLDIDAGELDDVAMEAVASDQVPAAVASIQAFPVEMLGMVVGSALAQAFIEGYVVRTLQEQEQGA
jgi:hypothetical protein